jgi:protein-S-isoprenylcysteine O-methyltransferase Ste14
MHAETATAAKTLHPATHALLPIDQPSSEFGNSETIGQFGGEGTVRGGGGRLAATSRRGYSPPGMSEVPPHLDEVRRMGKKTPLANIRLHPAVIVIGALAMEVAGRGLWKFSAESAGAQLLQGFGKGLMGLGILTLVLAYGAMARARTTIDPRRHTSAIVTGGIYRFSRNPIYLGWFLFMLGGGIANLSLFQVLVPFLMIALLRRAVVLKEEEYLAEVFGDTYLRYKDRVRRWL